MKFRLSDSLNPERLRRSFHTEGFVHIPKVLPTKNARYIRQALLENTPWNLVFNDRDQHIDLPHAQLQTMPPSKIRELQNAIYMQAGQGFQYYYNNYPIYDAYVAGENKGHPLHLFYEWLNGDEFLAFARTVSGRADIDFADAQATCYKQGHFLSTHDDSHEGKNRRAAYIFHFTEGWEPDWGGYLQLLDNQGHVRRGIKPVFNSLNIIRVPQQHNVAMVSPFAAGPRLCITGWLRHEKTR